MGWSKEVEELARHRAAGRLTVRERIDALIDPGSFVEIGALAGEQTQRGFVPSGYVV